MTRTRLLVSTEAVAELVAVGFGELGLHRLEAGTVPENARSQAVLKRNGFEQYGYAPRYLAIAGRWRDHLLFQRLNEAASGSSGTGGATHLEVDR